MGEINNEAICTNKSNYNWHGPGITDVGQRRSMDYDTGNNWSQQMYRVKECGIPSTGFLHPPIVREPPALVEPLSVNLPNEFVNQLYIKYPFLIPKGISQKDYKTIGQRSYTSEFSDLTTYQEAYGHKDFPEPPELVAAKGLSLPEPIQPPIRLPGVPYISLCRRPLLATDAVDLIAYKKDKKAAKKIISSKVQVIPKRITEYEDNINSLVRYWQKNNLYTNPAFYIPHKPTLPQD